MMHAYVVFFFLVYMYIPVLSTTIHIPAELSWFDLTLASEFLMYSQCMNAIDAWRGPVCLRAGNASTQTLPLSRGRCVAFCATRLPFEAKVARACDILLGHWRSHLLIS